MGRNDIRQMPSVSHSGFVERAGTIMAGLASNMRDML